MPKSMGRRSRSQIECMRDQAARQVSGSEVSRFRSVGIARESWTDGSLCFRVAAFQLEPKAPRLDGQTQPLQTRLRDAPGCTMTQGKPSSRRAALGRCARQDGKLHQAQCFQFPFITSRFDFPLARRGTGCTGNGQSWFTLFCFDEMIPELHFF